MEEYKRPKFSCINSGWEHSCSNPQCSSGCLALSQNLQSKSGFDSTSRMCSRCGNYFFSETLKNMCESCETKSMFSGVSKKIDGDNDTIHITIDPDMF